MIDTSIYRVDGRQPVHLDSIPTDDDGGLDKGDGRKAFRKLTGRLTDLQELLYADGRHAVLAVLQAMDAGGKDSTIRHVFGPVNPQGCRVHGFKVPSEEEREHDFLWRVHAQAPRAGHIEVFNRSHYEDVLVVRVKDLVPSQRWKKRYDHINAFERLLHDEGTAIVKFYLHISSDYQKERLQRRLDRPGSHWKFNPGDLADRELWPQFRAAYEDAINRCATPAAPWYIVPAEKRWFRDLLVAQVMVELLESLHLEYPKARFDPESVTIL